MGGRGHSAGRFPANVLLDEHAAKEMDKQSGVLKSGGGNKGPRSSSWFTSNSPNVDDVRNPDSGGASRFFPVFKSEEEAPETKGRFPANVLLDEHAAAEMDEQSGPAGDHGESRGDGTRGMLGWKSDNRQTTNVGSGGASRFSRCSNTKPRHRRKNALLSSVRQFTRYGTILPRIKWITFWLGSERPVQVLHKPFFAL